MRVIPPFAMVLPLAPFLLTSPAGAITAGAGNVSCRQFVEYYWQAPAETKEVFLTWAQGYMSGVYATLVETAKITGDTPQALFPQTVEGDARFLHLKQFCEEEPLARFDEAVVDLIEAIGRQQSTD